MSEPIRVLNVFMVLDRGGAETFVMNVYRQIDRKKVQFDFLVHGDKIGAYEEEIKSLGGRIYRLPRMTDFINYKKAIKKFFDNHPEYNVVHSHASELGLFVFKEASKRGITCRICHAHSAPQGVGMKAIIRFFFKKRMNHYSNFFFACSKRAGIWQFGKQIDFSVIKNGISVKRFVFDESIRNETRRALGIDDKMVIGHVGRFEKPKNHRFLVEVFEEISKRTESALLLIGEGSLKPEIEGLVDSKKLSDKVVFLGSQSDISKYLSVMDAFVFPSFFEGLGIVLIEAQTNGLNCYISDVIPKETDVTNLVTRLSLDLQPAAWAYPIISCKDSAFDRKQYPKIVEESGYDIKETVEQLQDLYLSYQKDRYR